MIEFFICDLQYTSVGEYNITVRKAKRGNNSTSLCTLLSSSRNLAETNKYCIALQQELISRKRLSTAMPNISDSCAQSKLALIVPISPFLATAAEGSKANHLIIHGSHFTNCYVIVGTRECTSTIYLHHII